MILAIRVFAANPHIRIGNDKDFDLGYIYYHASGTISDSNTLVISNTGDANSNDSFLGLPQYVLIDTNGTDTSFTIELWIDPTELGETQVSKLYLLKTLTLSSATHDGNPYVISAVDFSSNIFGGFPIIGKLYIGVHSCALDDLKLWLYYDKKKVIR